MISGTSTLLECVVSENAVTPMRSLETPRLLLEPQVTTHADEMFRVLSDPAIYEFENAPPASIEALRERYRTLESRRSPDGRQLWLNWVVRLRDAGLAIGYVQATVLAEGRALIAYEFGSAWWGQGYAHEATVAAIRELHEACGATTLGAVFKQTNHRSRTLLERLGLRPTGPGEFPGELREPDEAAMVMSL